MPYSKILAADVNGTLYLCYRHWTISVFPGRTSTDSQYHSAGKVSISVSMCKIQYWFWSVYEINRIVLCIFSNLLIYSYIPTSLTFQYPGLVILCQKCHINFSPFSSCSRKLFYLFNWIEISFHFVMTSSPLYAILILKQLFHLSQSHYQKTERSTLWKF